MAKVQFLPGAWLVSSPPLRSSQSHSAGTVARSWGREADYSSWFNAKVKSTFKSCHIHFILLNVSDSVGIYNFTGASDKGIGRTQSVVPILPAPSPVSSPSATTLLITTSTPVTVGQSIAHTSSQVSVLFISFNPKTWYHLNPVTSQLCQILAYRTLSLGFFLRGGRVQVFRVQLNVGKLQTMWNLVWRLIKNELWENFKEGFEW